MISINLECDQMYLPTSATNWNFSYEASTVNPEKITIKAINKGIILTLIELDLLLYVLINYCSNFIFNLFIKNYN